MNSQVLDLFPQSKLKNSATGRRETLKLATQHLEKMTADGVKERTAVYFS